MGRIFIINDLLSVSTLTLLTSMTIIEGILTKMSLARSNPREINPKPTLAYDPIL